MTPEAIDAAIDAGDVEACLALFAEATEKERSSVAKRTVARLRTLTADLSPAILPALHVTAPSDVWRPIRKVRIEVVQTAQAAVLASASNSTLKSLGLRALPPDEVAYRVLAARRPPWLQEWATRTLEQTPRWGDGHWPLIRRLVRDGLCARPDGLHYVDGMISSLARTAWQTRTALRTVLLDDPSLLEDDIWLIFETEPRPGALTTLSDTELGTDTYCWKTALVGFAADGTIARDRLLNACLSALERDFVEARSRWFVHLHDALDPSAGECATHAEHYFGLLTSRNPTTVTFAVKRLGAIQNQGALDAQRVIETIAPALQARAKATVKAALALLDQAAKNTPELRQQAATVAVDAFVHEAPDVHTAVLDLVERYGTPPSDELASLLRERADAVAPSQRARLDAWLGQTGATVATEEPEPLDLVALEQRIAALDPELARCAGVLAAMEVVRQGGGPVPVVLVGALEVPRLNPARRIEPVNDLDTLVDLFAAVLESAHAPDDVERVLDGVSRLCDQRPDDFEARVASLISRIDHQEPLAREHRIFVSELVRTLWGLARTWVSGEVVWKGYKGWGHLSGFFTRRVRGISRRVAQRQAAPLLSAPTHAGGWIDPRTLVARRRRWDGSGIVPDRHDEMLALLRLAPEHRAEALAEAQEFQDEFGAALRHALGGEGETVGPTPELWVAAARARAPEEDDVNVEARHPGLGPDAGRAASYKLLTKQATPNWLKYSSAHLIVTDPPMPPVYSNPERSAEALDLPTVMLHDQLAHNAGDPARWAATTWPLDREAFFSTGFEHLARGSAGSTAVSMSRPYLEVLGADPLLRPVSRWYLAVALSAPNAEEVGLATDALITAIDDGRLDAVRFGETLRTLLSSGLVKLTRWSKSLGDAARVSPLHAQVIAGALQHALVGDLTWVPKDAYTLLERLKELLISLGEPLSEPQTREALNRLTRSGKTGKLVQELLALKESPDRSPQRAAALRALMNRLERAETWARWSAEARP